MCDLNVHVAVHVSCAGLCALSVDNDNGFIAYPGSNQVCIHPAIQSPMGSLHRYIECTGVLWSLGVVNVKFGPAHATQW